MRADKERAEADRFRESRELKKRGKEDRFYLSVNKYPLYGLSPDMRP